jgi:hypothetical protein
MKNVLSPLERPEGPVGNTNPKKLIYSIESSESEEEENDSDETETPQERKRSTRIKPHQTSESSEESEEEKKSQHEDSGKELNTAEENQPSDAEFNPEGGVSDHPHETSDEEESGRRLRRRSNRPASYSLRRNTRSSKADDKSYSLRKKKNVDYSVFYMPRQSSNGAAPDLGFGLNQNRYDDSIFRFHSRRDEHRERRRINDSSDDEDDTPAFLRGRNVTVPRSNRGFLPANILELLNYQENALLNQLPEEERTVYEKDKITFLGSSKKGRYLSFI